MAELTEDQAGGQGQSEVGTEPWAEYGFDSPDAMVKEFAKLKDDLGKYKPDARKAKELESELSKLREAEEKRKQAEMSELERQQAALQKAKAEQEKLQAELEETRRGIIYERTVAERLAKYSEADRELIRDLYDAKAGTFADVDELGELLDSIDQKWKAHLDGLSGDAPRPDIGGGTRQNFNKKNPPASKDGQALAAAMAHGGVRELVKMKFGGKG